MDAVIVMRKGAERSSRTIEKIDLPEGKEVTVTVLDVPSGKDDKAFRRAAGSWKGLVDAETLIRNIHADCLISTRPEPLL